MSKWEKLSSQEQYAVSNKLLGTMYKGPPADEFFDFTTGNDSPPAMSKSNYLAEIKSKLSMPVDDLDSYFAAIDQKYTFDSKQQPIQYPLAMLHEFPLSRDLFNMWMAYVFSNTIDADLPLDPGHQRTDPIPRQQFRQMTATSVSPFQLHRLFSSILVFKIRKS